MELLPLSISVDQEYLLKSNVCDHVECGPCMQALEINLTHASHKKMVHCIHMPSPSDMSILVTLVQQCNIYVPFVVQMADGKKAKFEKISSLSHFATLVATICDRPIFSHFLWGSLNINRNVIMFGTCCKFGQSAQISCSIKTLYYPSLARHCTCM